MPRTRENTASYTCHVLTEQCIKDVNKNMSLSDEERATAVVNCAKHYIPPLCSIDGGKKSRRNKKQRMGGKSKRRSNGRRNKTSKKMRGGEDFLEKMG
jgi:hypothetical protein